MIDFLPSVGFSSFLWKSTCRDLELARLMMSPSTHRRRSFLVKLIGDVTWAARFLNFELILQLKEERYIWISCCKKLAVWQLSLKFQMSEFPQTQHSEFSKVPGTWALPHNKRIKKIKAPFLAQAARWMNEWMNERLSLWLSHRWTEAKEGNLVLKLICSHMTYMEHDWHCFNSQCSCSQSNLLTWACCFL